MKAKIAITIDEELLKLAKIAATKDNRSVSSLISVALAKYLEKKADRK